MNSQESTLHLSSNRQIFGVCAGIAEYLGWKPKTIRVLWLLGTLLSIGSLIIAYLVCVFTFPKPEFKFDLNDFKRVE